MAKTRVTGFTRFLLFMLFFLPAVWFGVNYYKGEDPVANFKDLTGMEQSDNTARTQGQTDFRGQSDEIANLRRELAITKEELARCRTKGVE